MNKGVSLYLSVLVMIVLLSIVLGLSTILVTQVKIIRGLENSVIAFYAADSGIERVLDEGENATDTVDYSFYLDNNAFSSPEYVATGTQNCPADVANFCINSKGIYKGTQRVIQVIR